MGGLRPRRSDSDYRWNRDRSARQCAGGHASDRRSRNSRNRRRNAAQRPGENADRSSVARSCRCPRKNADRESSRKSQGRGRIAASSRTPVSARGSRAARRPARLTLLSAVSRQSSVLQDSNFNSEDIFDGDELLLIWPRMVGDWSARYLIVQPDNRQAQKEDGVIGAQHSFRIHIDVKEFAQRAHVAHNPVVRPAIDYAIETGEAKRRAGRDQAKRSVRVRDRAEVHVRAAVTGESNFHTSILLAG